MNDSTWRVVAAAAGVVTVGCSTFAIGAAVSSDSDSNSAPAESVDAGTTTTAAAAASTAPAGGATTTAPAGGASSSAPGTSGPAAPAAVTIENFAFGPEQLEVPVGSTVTWTNLDGNAHSVLSADEVLMSPDLDEGDTYEVTLDQEGTIDYICNIHQYMHGSIVVTP